MVDLLGNEAVDDEQVEEGEETMEPWYKPVRNLARQEILNVFHKPVGNLATWAIEEVVTEGGKLKIGFFGVAEEEWLGQFSSDITEKFIYRDYIETAKEMSAWLREKKRCDIIIALTHMRVPNDRILA